MSTFSFDSALAFQEASYSASGPTNETVKHPLSSVPRFSVQFFVTELSTVNGDETYEAVLQCGRNNNWKDIYAWSIKAPGVTTVGGIKEQVLTYLEGQEDSECRIQFNLGGTNPAITVSAQIAE